MLARFGKQLVHSAAHAPRLSAGKNLFRAASMRLQHLLGKKQLTARRVARQ